MNFNPRLELKIIRGEVLLRAGRDETRKRRDGHSRIRSLFKYRDERAHSLFEQE